MVIRNRKWNKTVEMISESEGKWVDNIQTKAQTSESIKISEKSLRDI